MTLAIQTHIDLAPFNTMGFAVYAKRYVSIRSAQELMEYFKAEPDVPCFILGGGSNLVFTRDVETTVLHMQMLGIAVYEESDTHVVVGVQAGEVWHNFVMTCVAKGWMGLENLALIPGSVGASPVQNIGAYGAEVKDTLLKVKAWDRLTHKWTWLENDDCQFAYRDSIFKHEFLDANQQEARYVISKVFFKLLKDKHQWQPKMTYGDIAVRVAKIAENTELEPKHLAQAIIDIRNSKLPDPKILGNAGSFFKNPVVDSAIAAELKNKHPDMPTYTQPNDQIKIAAGWLIEQAGFKGLRDYTVGVYEKQALVLVHYGQGNGMQLMALAQRIVDTVYSQFGVLISPEPIVY